MSPELSQAATARAYWRRMVTEMERYMDALEREREEANRETTSWKAAFDQAILRAQTLERERDALKERLSELEEVLDFVLLSHDAGVSKMSRGVTGALRAVLRPETAAAPRNAAKRSESADPPQLAIAR